MQTQHFHDELIIGRLERQMNEAVKRGDQARAEDIAARIRVMLENNNDILMQRLNALKERMLAGVQSKGDMGDFAVFQASDDAVEDMIHRSAGLSFQENSV